MTTKKRGRGRPTIYPKNRVGIFLRLPPETAKALAKRAKENGQSRRVEAVEMLTSLLNSPA